MESIGSIKDVLIIGGGPAGLAAATTLVRQLHTVVIFDSGTYRNGTAKHMHNVPTWDHKNPADFRASAKHDLITNYQGVEFVDHEITNLKEVDERFEASDQDGRIWTAKKVILATGVDDIMPEIPGYAACWGTSIGESAGVLAIGICAQQQIAMHLARNAAQLCRTVNVYTNGSKELSTALSAALASDSKFQVNDRVIQGLLVVEKGIQISFGDGSTKVESFLGHVPMSRPRGNFVEQLQLKTSLPMGDIEVSLPFLQTSRRGVFAAGDNMTMAKAVAIAVANGATAASSASTQLQTDKYGHPQKF